MKAKASHILSVVLFLMALSSTNALAQCCVEPESETTAVAATWNTTFTQFNQAIANLAGDSFDGMSVQEGVAAAGADTCHFTGSAFPPFNQITGGTWTVSGDDVTGQHNHWGYDTVGVPTSWVTYYRAQDPPRGIAIPCGFTIYQSMSILCGSTWTVYTPSFGNKLTVQIDTSTVQNCRNDMNNTACQTISF